MLTFEVPYNSRLLAHDLCTKQHCTAVSYARRFGKSVLQRHEPLDAAVRCTPRDMFEASVLSYSQSFVSKLYTFYKVLMDYKNAYPIAATCDISCI